MPKAIVGVLTAIAALASNCAVALILDIVGGGIAGGDSRSGTIGWSFHLDVPAVVVALGYWDEGGDGLVDAHPVGLWKLDGTLDGNLQTQTTVTNASPITIASVSGLGVWRFQPLVVPQQLAPGDYVLGGFYPGGSLDLFRFAGTSFETLPGITYTGARDQQFAPGLAFPLPVNQPPGAYFGPTLLTPEPSTAALLAIGLTAFALGKRRPRTGAR